MNGLNRSGLQVIDFEPIGFVEMNGSGQLNHSIHCILHEDDSQGKHQMANRLNRSQF